MKRPIKPGVTPCPSCGQIGLELTKRFQVKDSTTNIPLGTYKELPPLKGKFTPYLSCRSGCGWETWGRTEPGYVVFTFDLTVEDEPNVVLENDEVLYNDENIVIIEAYRT